jgi:hypothetical protein
MSSFVDTFWQAVEHWEKDQSELVLEVFRRHPRLECNINATVLGAEGKTVTFRDAENGKEWPLKFDNAMIQPHSFARLNAVCSFIATWEDENPEASLKCVLTELRAARR